MQSLQQGVKFGKKLESYFPVFFAVSIRGPMTSEGEDGARRLQLGKRIDDKRRKLGLTLQELGKKAGYSDRTIQNAIDGEPTRAKTIFDICKALNLDLDEEEEFVAVADKHGKYTLEQYQNYEGWYLAHRRSFTVPNTVLRSVFEIRWHDDSECLGFQESQRYESSSKSKRILDFSQRGEVYISNSVGLVHLLTHQEGALRLITLTKLDSNDNTLQGIVLTQAQRSKFHQPSVSPIFLQKVDGVLTPEDIAAKVGPLKADMADYEPAESLLREIETNVAICAFSGSTTT